MDTEAYVIAQVHSTKIGDDGAIVADWVCSKDLFCEGVHFKRDWLSPYAIGRKAMLVNLSDAIAMNATPRYALVGLAIPRDWTRAAIAELQRGMHECAVSYGVEIIGGDTIANTKLDLSITILAHADQPLTRRGLKLHDRIAYTGKLGSSARTLRYLLAGGSVHGKSRFVAPTLRGEFVRRTRRWLRCGMDLSDGLFADARKLCQLNAKTLHWDRPIRRDIGCSGEEYEMLIAFDRRHERRIHRWAERTRTPLHVVGSIRRGSVRFGCRSHHF